MMGSARPSPVTISNKSVSDDVADPANAFASYKVAADRLVKNQNGTTLEQWLDSSYSASDFEIRATVTFGTTPTGNIGTWNNLATDRSWSLSQTVVGTKSAVLLIEIGYAGQNVALDSATVTIDVDVS
jgi:hypothetical protein